MNKEKDFVKLVENLQRKIEQDEEKIYSRKVIQEYRNPTNFGIIEKPDTAAEITGPCGDTMKITLNIENNVIQKASFWTDGCGATLACGNRLIKMITGVSLDEVTFISYEKLIKNLDGLPKEHDHCAKLAVDTLNKAIENYHKKRK